MTFLTWGSEGVKERVGGNFLGNEGMLQTYYTIKKQ